MSPNHLIHWCRLALLVATCVVSTGIPRILVAADPLDWPYWRGPEGNSISRETGLPDTINPAGGEGSNLLWSSTEGAGRSTPVVMNGKLYTLTRSLPGTHNESERVLCLNAETGEKVWENQFNVWSSDVPDTRVGWSSVVGDPESGDVFALGVCGLFQCIDGATGKTKWSIPLHEQFGLVTTYGGRTNLPIVFEDTVILGGVIVNWDDMAVPAHRLLCFDKATGAIRWFTSTRLRPEDTIYSGPTLAVIGGQQLLLTGSGDGYVYAFQPRTGKKVWDFHLSRRGLNLSPTVVGETVYMGHNEENPTGTKVGAVVAIDGSLTADPAKRELWRSYEVDTGKASILALNDRLYCFGDAGKLFVLDAKTGEQIGRKVNLGTICHSTPLYADGKIYYMEKNGRWYILTPDDKEGVKKPARGKTTGDFPKYLDPASKQTLAPECWASPVVSHGKLYIQTTAALYCFQDKKKKPGADERPKVATETPAGENEAVAQIQIVPSELLVRPGDTRKLTVRAYDAAGRFLKEVTDAAFTVEGPAKVADGALTANADAKHEKIVVATKIGEATAKARVRVVPPLPWKFDFEGLKDAPITWVGARYRHRISQVDGSTALVKVTTIPRGTRSRCFFGQSDLHDYTVQADLRGSLQDKKLPVMGLIAQGYKLAVEGEAKKIMITTWDSHDHRTRIEKPFAPEANVWYTFKLKVANDGDKAKVQGKVWKRGEEEPAAWNVELEDELPVKQGAPGLYGDATNAEVSIDNVSVVPNE